MPKEICVSKFTDSSNPGQPIGCDGTGSFVYLFSVFSKIILFPILNWKQFYQ